MALPLLPEEHRLDAKQSMDGQKDLSQEKRNGPETTTIVVCNMVLTALRAQSRAAVVGVVLAGCRQEGLHN